MPPEKKKPPVARGRFKVERWLTDQHQSLPSRMRALVLSLNITSRLTRILKTQLVIEPLRADIMAGCIRVQVAILLAQQELSQARQKLGAYSLASVLLNHPYPGQIGRVACMSVCERVQVSYLCRSNHLGAQPHLKSSLARTKAVEI